MSENGAEKRQLRHNLELKAGEALKTIHGITSESGIHWRQEELL